jgi:hypothetical protein
MAWIELKSGIENTGENPETTKLLEVNLNQSLPILLHPGCEPL